MHVIKTLQMTFRKRFSNLGMTQTYENSACARVGVLILDYMQAIIFLEKFVLRGGENEMNLQLNNTARTAWQIIRQRIMNTFSPFKRRRLNWGFSSKQVCTYRKDAQHGNKSWIGAKVFNMHDAELNKPERRRERYDARI